ncbi:MAG: retron system putative HNH endonuclease [Bacteroidota bacterium]|nr:retron system putative HNH endonuclease [Bacteroidota bacterium]
MLSAIYFVFCFVYGSQKNKINARHKVHIRYCERRIEESDYHIEHFYEQHDFQNKIYDYDNMFISCDGDKNKIKDIKELQRIENISCGNKKTKSFHNDIEINYSLLLNPSDSGVSLLFSYLHGYISFNNSCSKEEKNKVKYTISRLNLDCDKLNIRRKNRIIGINSQLKELNKSEKSKFIRELLKENKTQLSAYYSTIKDNFDYLVS